MRIGYLPAAVAASSPELTQNLFTIGVRNDRAFEIFVAANGGN